MEAAITDLFLKFKLFILILTLSLGTDLEQDCSQGLRNRNLHIFSEVNPG